MNDALSNRGVAVGRGRGVEDRVSGLSTQILYSRRDTSAPPILLGPLATGVAAKEGSPPESEEKKQENESFHDLDRRLHLCM